MNGSPSRGSGDSRPDLTTSVVTAAQQVLDRLRAPSTPASTTTAPADVRAVVLAALAEAPGSGYDVVRRLGTDGPGAGAVYPMLQLLADEGLVTAEQEGERRIWSVTTAGRAAATDVKPDRPLPRDLRAPSAGRGGLAKESALLAQTVALAVQTGSTQQIADATATLEDARRRLLAILAQG